MGYRILWVLVLVMMAISCAPKQKQLTRQEILELRQKQIKIATRIYTNVTKEDALIAVDKIFRLADKDYKINHTENSVSAKRHWSLYLVLTAVFGVDNWTINATEVPEGIKVIIKVGRSSQNLAPMATSGGDWTATTLPPIEETLDGNAIYHLFFSRLDFLLGKSDLWIDCKTASALISGRKYYQTKISTLPERYKKIIIEPKAVQVFTLGKSELLTLTKDTYTGIIDPFCTVANDDKPEELL